MEFGFSADVFVPSLARDDSFRQSWARFERFAVSPAGFKARMRMLDETDARHIRPVIRVPTLIVHREGDRVARIEGARYMAERISGVDISARRFRRRSAPVTWSSPASMTPWVGDVDTIFDEIEEFLTGERHGGELDRVLATVLFTDIVASTERAAQMVRRSPPPESLPYLQRRGHHDDTGANPRCGPYPPDC